MTYQPYLGWGLNNFEDTMNALAEFPQGGWWLRKVDHKDAFNKEFTEGPYDEKTAKKKAYNWNKFFDFKGLKAAQAYSFKDLICNYQERYNYLKESLYPEYIWRPPSGAQLLCIKKIMLIKKPSFKDSNFEKFSIYIQSKDIKLRDFQNYQIYYKDKDYLAYEQSKKLERLIKDYKDYPDQLWGLYRLALGEKNNIPEVIPYYIKSFNKDNKPYSLDFFIRFQKLENRDKKIKCLMNSLKKEKIDFTFPKNNQYTIGYNLPLIYNKEDFKIKNLLFSITPKEELIIEIKEDENYVKLRAPKDNRAQLSFNLPIENNENIFNDKLITLFLFVCKQLKIYKINLKDNLKEYCKCDQIKKEILYINIVRFLASQESTYQEMGFIEENIDKRKDIIDKFKEQKISKFINLEEEDLLAQKTLSELANDYLNGYCQFNYVCQLLNTISVKIFENLKDCCFEYYIDLKNYPLEQLRNKLK